MTVKIAWRGYTYKLYLSPPQYEILVINRDQRSFCSAKPALKKVSKYDNKFKKMLGGEGAEGKAPKADFRSNLKVVKKTENVIDDVIAKVGDVLHT